MRRPAAADNHDGGDSAGKRAADNHDGGDSAGKRARAKPRLRAKTAAERAETAAQVAKSATDRAVDAAVRAEKSAAEAASQAIPRTPAICINPLQAEAAAKRAEDAAKRAERAASLAIIPRTPLDAFSSRPVPTLIPNTPAPAPAMLPTTPAATLANSGASGSSGDPPSSAPAGDFSGDGGWNWRESRDRGWSWMDDESEPEYWDWERKEYFTPRW